MTYLLDTTALIDYAKGWEPARSTILALLEGQDMVGVCAVSVAEFVAALPPAQRAEWVPFFTSLTTWDITREDGFQAGIWLYDYGRQGITLSPTDTLIAAVAVRVQATLVTDNIKHYPMPEVHTLSPRKQAA